MNVWPSSLGGDKEHSAPRAGPDEARGGVRPETNDANKRLSGIYLCASRRTPLALPYRSFVRTHEGYF